MGQPGAAANRAETGAEWDAWRPGPVRGGPDGWPAGIGEHVASARPAAPVDHEPVWRIDRWPENEPVRFLRPFSSPAWLYVPTGTAPRYRVRFARRANRTIRPTGKQTSPSAATDGSGTIVAT